jgi:hypothetical protein
MGERQCADEMGRGHGCEDDSCTTGTTGDLTALVEYCSNTLCRGIRYSSSLCIVIVRGNKGEKRINT